MAFRSKDLENQKTFFSQASMPYNQDTEVHQSSEPSIIQITAGKKKKSYHILYNY